jgi:hypothetical protein
VEQDEEAWSWMKKCGAGWSSVEQDEEVWSMKE